MYEELAVSETKAAFLQSIVSSILVEMIFNAYFVGLPEEKATQLSQVEKYLENLSTFRDKVFYQTSNFPLRFN